MPSGRYTSLEALVSDFLAQVELKPDRASFGVAGPVVAGRATITNLPWVMSETQLQTSLDLSPGGVRLLNDLTAVAYAVPWLESDDLHTLNEWRPVPGGAIAVIAPGTGLGEGFLMSAKLEDRRALPVVLWPLCESLSVRAEGQPLRWQGCCIVGGVSIP